MVKEISKRLVRRKKEIQESIKNTVKILKKVKDKDYAGFLPSTIKVLKKIDAIYGGKIEVNVRLNKYLETGTVIIESSEYEGEIYHTWTYDFNVKHEGFVFNEYIGVSKFLNKVFYGASIDWDDASEPKGLKKPLYGFIYSTRDGSKTIEIKDKYNVKDLTLEYTVLEDTCVKYIDDTEWVLQMVKELDNINLRVEREREEKERKLRKFIMEEDKKKAEDEKGLLPGGLKKVNIAEEYPGGLEMRVPIFNEEEEIEISAEEIKDYKFSPHIIQRR